MSYPLELYKKHDGNLQQRYANTKEEEQSLRNGGFQTLEELHAAPSMPKVTAQKKA
jgi:hypothetical protein